MEHLKSKIDEDNPYFADLKIKAWDNAFFQSLFPFIKEHYWCGHQSINIFRVVGTIHPDYIGMTWYEFLQKGKRMFQNIALHKANARYYHTADKKDPGMFYLSLDGGDLYVGEDGNHRTCIAKFDFYYMKYTTLHGVTLNDYKINWTLKKYFDMIQAVIDKKNLPYRVLPVRETISREDSAGWMLEKYITSFKVTDLRKNSEFFLKDLTEIESFLDKINNNVVITLLKKTLK